MNWADINDIVRKSLSTLKPPAKLTVAEWADAERRLSAEASALPGKWRTSVVPYLEEPMNCVSDPSVRRLSIKAAAQVAKTELILNVIGYCVDHDPSPIMCVQPTLDMATVFSKDRLSPMLRDTPALKGKVDDSARQANNTILQKKFPGGHIAIVGANSPSSLASRPIRVVLGDEVDRFPHSAGSEGDPIQLAVKRSATFWNRILIFVSTPTVEGESRIDDEYRQGDQRQFHVPCPHCGEYRVLEWSNVRWYDEDPDTAEYIGDCCGVAWTDSQRIVAVRRGRWVAQKPFKGHASFHISGLISPFVSLSDGVREFMAAKGNPERLKVWVNTYLGETWEDEGERLDFHDLQDHKEVYETTIPAEVTLLTAGVDVQDDRLEVEIVGWGDDYESWSIGYRVIYGDLSAPEIWRNLQLILSESYHHPIFGDIGIRLAGIDSGGHYTQQVYKFAKTVPRVAALKGVGGQGAAMIGKPSTRGLAKVQLIPVGVHAAKEIVYSRAKVHDPGSPGYCHWPDREEYDEAYFRGFVSEKLVTRFSLGKKRTEYVKIQRRNEPLDLRVYATIALEILNVDLNAQRRRALMDAAERAKEIETEDDAPPEPYIPGADLRRPKKNWATRW